MMMLLLGFTCIADNTKCYFNCWLLITDTYFLYIITLSGNSLNQWQVVGCDVVWMPDVTVAWLLKLLSSVWYILLAFTLPSPLTSITDVCLSVVWQLNPVCSNSKLFLIHRPVSAFMTVCNNFDARITYIPLVDVFVLCYYRIRSVTLETSMAGSRFMVMYSVRHLIRCYSHHWLALAIRLHLLHCALSPLPSSANCTPSKFCCTLCIGIWYCIVLALTIVRPDIVRWMNWTDACSPLSISSMIDSEGKLSYKSDYARYW